MTNKRFFELSHSSVKLKNSCARKYQMYKLIRHPNMYERESTIHTAFGSAVGAGVQSYLVDQDINKAYHEAFVNWDFYLWEKLHGKFFSAALEAINRAVPWVEKLLEDGYKVATINDRPATEVAFKIIIPDRAQYVGFIDAVMIHEDTGKYLNLELKTMNRMFHPSAFENSAQDLGYLAVTSIAGDAHMATWYPVCVAMASDLYWVTAKFERTDKQLQEFLLSLQIELVHLELMETLGVYPKNGDACLAWGRVCPMYGECDKTYTKTWAKKDEAHVPKVFDLEVELVL